MKKYDNLKGCLIFQKFGIKTLGRKDPACMAGFLLERGCLFLEKKPFVPWTEEERARHRAFGVAKDAARFAKTIRKEDGETEEVNIKTSLNNPYPVG